MNLIYLSENPRECAEWIVDKHLKPAILNTLKMLSTAHRVLDGFKIEVEVQHKETGKKGIRNVWVLPDYRNDIVYDCTAWNHASVRWCRESVENYNWSVDYLYALGQEYEHRNGTKHDEIERCFYTLQSPPFGLSAWDWSECPSALPRVHLISDNPIENYRHYYKSLNPRLHKWTKRDAPVWINI